MPCGGATKRPFGVLAPENPTRRIKKHDATIKDFMKVCSTALTQPATHKIDVGEFEATGIAIAKKLQRMDPVQAIYADSIINSVLRRGLLKTLKPHTDLCDNRCGMMSQLQSPVPMSSQTASSEESQLTSPAPTSFSHDTSHEGTLEHQPLSGSTTIYHNFDNYDNY